MSAWSAWSHGSGTRRWFVARDDGSAHHEGRSGALVRYATYGAAARAARRLNGVAGPGEEVAR